MRLALVSLCFVLSASAAAACAAGERSGFDDGPAAVADGGDVDGATGDAGGFAPGTAEGGRGDGRDIPREVYGHSRDTLYKLDPETNAVTTVGKLEGCGPLIDLAINQDGEIFGDSESVFYAIDKVTAKCTELARGTYPTSLSFVPEGTFGATEELVGYEEGVYIRIDTKTGAKTTVGNLGGNLISSGDIVSIKDGPTYLTVKPADPKDKGSCSENDCLVEIDPKTGRMLKNWGPVGHKSVFGLAYWGGEIFGFSNDGKLFEMSLTTGSLKSNVIDVPGAPSGLSFWGAGSSTLAPIGPR